MEVVARIEVQMAYVSVLRAHGGRTSTSIAPAADVAFEASASCSTQYTAGKGFSFILNFLLPDVQLIISWSLQEAG